MIKNSKVLLNIAKDSKSVIYQFNSNGLENTRYILEASNELNIPVILGFSEGAIKYIGGFETVVNIVKSLITDLNIETPVIIHLDHGSSVEICKLAIDAGFSSVMYDGSKLSLPENIKNTKEIVDYAKLKDVSVEGELGPIGTSLDQVSYTNVDDAVLFVKETDVDSLAVAVGSVHGLYKSEPKINYELIKEINDQVNIPLVLHGGSDLPPETLKACVSNGISKININTDLQIAWANALRTYLEENPSIYDPRKIIGSGQTAFKDKLKEYLNLFS